MVIHFSLSMRLLLFVLLLAALHLPFPLQAQTAWSPERNVEIVVGTGPGSSPDRVARLIQSTWQEQKSVAVPVTVVNKPGGNNSIGWTYLNQQGGDGHYLMIGVVNLSLGVLTGATKLGYRDVTPVSLLFHEYTALIVRPDSPIKTAQELVERLKKDPSGLSLAVSTAAGGANHLAAALALKGAGVDVKKIRTVVFGSGGASVTALLGGHVDVIALSPSVVIPHLTDGRLRGLAALAPKRLGGPYASVPTFRELGVKPVLSKYRAIIGPKDMRAEHVAFWEAQFEQLSQDAAWKQELDKFQWEGEFMNSSQLKVFMEETHKDVEDALRDIGMLKQR
jgi:putative tricarboxylic transport membrane protein